MTSRSSAQRGQNDDRFRFDGVRAVAERAVRRCAPQESAYFDLVADDFFARGTINSGRRTSRGRLLRFGPDDVSVAVSAAALSVVTIMSTGSLEAFGQMTAHGVVDRIRGWWRRRRKLHADPNAPVALPAKETAESLILMVRAARQCGLSEAEAAQLATAVLAEVQQRQ